MKKTVILMVVAALGLAACAPRVPTQNCLMRKEMVEHVAAISKSELTAGLTMDEVRAILRTEPSEVISVKGTDGLITWKYYLSRECEADLNTLAPSTELIFLQGRLLKWRSYAK